jgi:hypothetical protein
LVERVAHSSVVTTSDAPLLERDRTNLRRIGIADAGQVLGFCDLLFMPFVSCKVRAASDTGMVGAPSGIGAHMIDTTADGSLDAAHLAEAKRIFRDRSRYQSRELAHLLGSSRDFSSADGDRACHLMRSESQVDDDSIVRGID